MCVRMHMNVGGWGACGCMCLTGLCLFLNHKAALTRCPGSGPRRKARLFLLPTLSHAPHLSGQSEKNWQVDTQDYAKVGGASDVGH